MACIPMHASVTCRDMSKTGFAGLPKKGQIVGQKRGGLGAVFPENGQETCDSAHRDDYPIPRKGRPLFFAYKTWSFLPAAGLQNDKTLFY